VVIRTQVFSVTTFAFMSRQTQGFAGPELATLNDCGNEGCSYTKFYQFKGVVGIYAVFFAYSVVLVGLYVIRKAPPPATEVTSYAFLTAAMITFFVMSVVECTSFVIDSSYPICKNASYAKASLWFALATICLNGVTLYLGGKQWADHGFKGFPTEAVQQVFGRIPEPDESQAAV